MKKLRILTGLLTAATAVTAVWLALTICLGHDGNGQMYTAERIGAGLRILRWPALLTVVSAVATLLTGGSAAAAEKTARNSYAGGGCGETPAVPSYVKIVLAVFAAVLIAAGIANGGMRDVLIKAINICSECIGLG